MIERNKKSEKRVDFCFTAAADQLFLNHHSYRDLFLLNAGQRLLIFQWKGKEKNEVVKIKEFFFADFFHHELRERIKKEREESPYSRELIN